MKQLPAKLALSVHDVCAVLEVSQATLRRMIRKGEFEPADIKHGTQLLWSFNRVEQHVNFYIFEERQRLKAGAEALDRLEDSISAIKIRVDWKRAAKDHSAHQMITGSPWYVRLVRWIMRS